LLEAEVAPHADWAIWHVLIAPSLALHSLEATAIGDDTWQVRLVVQNTGWLPTNITQKALDRKAVKPLVAEIALSEAATASGAEIIGTEWRKELGQLKGRVGTNSMLGGFGAWADGTVDRAKAEWVVRAAPGTEVFVEARHDRAGVVRAALTLGD
jgi:hypothetical protein